MVVGVEPGQYITAEDIATKLAKKSMVELCFHRLNLEGILSQGYNQAPHDSTRDPYAWGVGDSSWQATVYKKISVIQQENER